MTILNGLCFGFTEPHLDLFSTVPQLYDWHYEHNPDYPAFVYHSDLGERTYVTYRSLIPAAHKAGFHIANRLNIDLTAGVDSFPTVVILTTAGSFMLLGSQF